MRVCVCFIESMCNMVKRHVYSLFNYSAFRYELITADGGKGEHMEKGVLGNKLLPVFTSLPFIIGFGVALNPMRMALCLCVSVSVSICVYLFAYAYTFHTLHHR